MGEIFFVRFPQNNFISLGDNPAHILIQQAEPTSPSEFTRYVRILPPVPQLPWFFHTRTEGGLWDTPASAPQI